MHTPDFVPEPAAPLKLTRRVSYITDSVTHEPIAAAQLAADFEALREREENLRAYEARLRAWQERIDAGGHAQTATTSASAPEASDSLSHGSEELNALWDRFHRARALLQAEQYQLRDERMAWQDRIAELERREQAVIAREASLTERERLVEEVLAAANEPKSDTTVRRLTQAPLSAARAIFGGGR